MRVFTTQNLIAVAVFVMALAITTLAYSIATIASRSFAACSTEAWLHSQHAGREDIAAGIWKNHYGKPEIAAQWSGMASDDRAAAEACR